MKTIENDHWSGFSFLNSQLHTLNTNESFKQNPQNPSVSMSSRLIILSLSGIGSRRRRHSMCCPASRTHTADPPVWSPRLLRRSVLLCDSGLCARWLMCNVYAPADTCQNAAASAGLGWSPLWGEASLWLFISNYQSSAVPEALRPSRHGDYPKAPGGPTRSWDPQWCPLFTCCLWVHLLMHWLVRLQWPQRKAGMQTIIWHFPTITQFQF